MKIFLILLISFCCYCQENISVNESLPEQDHIIVLDFNSVIHHGLANFFDRVVEKSNNNTKAIILELNTPGGNLEATRRIIDQFFKTKFPIIIHVTPNTGSATSAGVFLATAAHYTYMTPGSSIGSAHPVQGDGKDVQGDMRKKIENFAVTNIVSLAQQRHRNQEWVKKAVIESASLQAEEAVKLNVVDGLAKDLNELLLNLSGKVIKINNLDVKLGSLEKIKRIKVSPSFVDRVISFLTEPSIMSFLWMIAVLGISVEFYHPGLIFPGLVGVICFVLALMTMNLLSVSTTGMVLLAVGSGLIFTEVLVSSGLFGAVGAISLGFGFFFLFEHAQVWGIQPNYYLVYSILAVLILIFIFIAKEIISSFKYSGKDSVVGASGVVTHDLAPEGKVKINGVFWLANSEKPLKSGVSIKVIKRSGLKLTVEEA